MMTYEEFLDDMVPVNLHTPMRRADYYKKYMPDCDPKDFYNQLVKLWKENGQT